MMTGDFGKQARGSFFVKSYILLLIHNDVETFPARFMWESCAAKKVAYYYYYFGWSIEIECLPLFI